MVLYKELPIDYFNNKHFVVYGCGRYGRKCIYKLEKAGFDFNIIDKQATNFNNVYKTHEVHPFESLYELDNNVIIILTIQDFSEPLQEIYSTGKNKVVLYHSDGFYSIEDISVLNGVDNAEDLQGILQSMPLYLIGGDDRKIQDFMYVFDWLHLKRINYDEIEKHKNDDCIFLFTDKNEICTPKEKSLCVEELFTLLDLRNTIKGKIPSVMMQKTYGKQGFDQWKCRQPFNRLQLSSDFSAHFCCGDWSENLGYLDLNSVEEIWNSDVAKIFRLSIINRTYSFCYPDRCVHLKTNPATSNDRIDPPFTKEPTPKYIEIGIDKTCNLYCRSCRNNVIVESGNKKARNEAVTQSIINSGFLEKADSILLGGQGEVFVSPVYRKLMYETNMNQSVLDLRTNGVLFCQKEIDTLLDRYKSIRVIVSIDAASKETYQKLRRSNDPNTWDKLMRNLEGLKKARQNNNLTWFQINMCVQQENYMEIPAFVDMGMRLNVDRVYITPIRNWGTYTEEEFENVKILDSDKYLTSNVSKIVEPLRGNPKVLFAF